MNKFMKFFIAFAVLYIFSLSTAYCDTRHHIVYDQVDNTATNYQSTTNTYQIGSMAEANALSAHQFDFTSKAWQGSVSAGFDDGQEAISFGLAKRFKDTLISGAVAKKSGHVAVGFHF